MQICEGDTEDSGDRETMMAKVLLWLAGGLQQLGPARRWPGHVLPSRRSGRSRLVSLRLAHRPVAVYLVRIAGQWPPPAGWTVRTVNGGCRRDAVRFQMEK